MVSCVQEECQIQSGARSTLLAELVERLPYVTSWPRDASNAFLKAVRDRYFCRTHAINRFHYGILLHKAESLKDALETFSREAAFATHAGRSALLEVIHEARAHMEWCKPDVLGELERYTTYAFVLDGTIMTCGIGEEQQ